MKNNASLLVDSLRHGEIIHAIALPFSQKGFYADILFITSEENLRIVGEGVDLPSGEESFFLNLIECEDEDKYWVDKQGVSAWPPQSNEQWSAVDLVIDVKKYGLEGTLTRNRQVRFYRDEAQASQIGSRGILKSAAAVSFGTGASVGRQLLIYATPRFPCSLEVVIEPSKIHSIIAGLNEFIPDGIDS